MQVRNNKNFSFAIMALVLIAASFTFGSSYAAASTSVGISMHVISSPTNSSVNGIPLLLTDVWNYVNVTIQPNPTEGVSLIAFYGNTVPSNRTPLNYYEWAYSESNNSWYDPIYGNYVNVSLSSVHGNEYSFVSGMYDKADVGTWTLEIFNGSNFIDQLEFDVSQPAIGLVVSAPAFDVVVEPFTNNAVNSSEFGELEMTKNSGSIPETVTFNFGASNSFISATLNNLTVQPGETVYHSITVYARNWSPQIINFSGTVTAEFTDQIQGQNYAQYVPDVQFPVNGAIYVGHEGYAIYALSNVTVQFRSSATAAYGEMDIIGIYLSGNGPVTVNVSSSALKVLFVSGGNENYTSSVSFVLSKGTETEVKIGFEPVEDRTTGWITAVVSIPGSPVSKSFVTKVSVTGIPSSAGHGGVASQDANFSSLMLSTTALVSALLAVILIRRTHGRAHIAQKGKKIPTRDTNARGRRDSVNRSERIKPRKNWER